MTFYLIAGLVIIFLYLLYYFYFGPSKLERDIKKNGGFHNCFYCIKEIHINELKCKHCEKINYSGMRKNKKKQFFVIVILALFSLVRIYDRMMAGY